MEVCDKLQKIRQKSIIKIFGGTIAERGHNYYKEGRVKNPIAQFSKLTADVIGSASKPYKSSITIEGNDVIPNCNCPYDGYACKHSAALLYLWVKSPKKFNYLDKFDKSLSKKSKEELIEVIKEISEEFPDTLNLIHLLTRDKKKKIDVNDFKKRVKDLLSGYYDYKETQELIVELNRIKRELELIIDQKNHETVVEMLKIFVPLLINGQEHADDSNGRLAEFSEEIMALYSKIVPKVYIKEEERKTFFLWCIDLLIKEDYGFDEAISNLILNNCQEDEFKLIEKICFEKLEHELSKEYYREKIYNFLLYLYEQNKQDNMYISLCESNFKKFNYAYQLIEKLMSLKKFREAITYCDKALKITRGFNKDDLKILKQECLDKMNKK